MTSAEYKALKPKKKPAAKWEAPKQSESESLQQVGAVRLDIKPLSVNAAWKGTRYKTDAYKVFENAVLFLMPKLQLPAAPYKVQLVFGFSNYAADIDNPTKMILDCAQKKYGFNDKHIVELHVRKEIVPKGSEFIEFNIETAN